MSKALPQTPAPPIAGWPASPAGVSGPFPPPALPGFDGTTNPSAPAPRIGTRLLRGLPLGGLPWRSPLASRRQVPTFRTRASRWSHAVFMPVAARPVGRLPPSFVAGQQREPGFGDVPTLSTPQQRFTHVRLTSAHLTGLLPPFAATLTTSAIGPRQLAVVWTLILQSEPEGPTLISCAARLPGAALHHTLLAPSWRTIVGIAHDDHLARRVARAPLLDPEIVDIMEVHVRKARGDHTPLGCPLG